MTECQHVIIVPSLVSDSPPTYLVADIKAPKMLNGFWASIFAMWFLYILRDETDFFLSYILL